MVVKNVGRMQKQGGPNKSEREVTRHRRKYFQITSPMEDTDNLYAILDGLIIDDVSTDRKAPDIRP